MSDHQTRTARLDAAVAKYARTSGRLRARYRLGDTLTITEGGKPTKFSRQAEMAWRRFQDEYPEPRIAC